MKVKEESENWLKTQHSKDEDYGIFMTSHSLHGVATRRGKSGSSDRFFPPWAPKSLQMVTAAIKFKNACSLEEKL